MACLSFHEKFLFSDAAFIAGIQAYDVESPVVFDIALLNPGGHFDKTTGEYRVPYTGLYQFTVAFQASDLKSTCYF